MVRLFTIVFLCLAAEVILAQNNSAFYQVVEDLIEELGSNTLIDYDYNELAEDLLYYAEHPLNLNTASTDDLEKLWVLNTFQIKSLQYYIQQYGNLQSLFELQLIDGFDRVNIARIMPFIRVENTKEDEAIAYKKVLKYGNNNVFLRSTSLIETPLGYLPTQDSASTIAFAGSKPTLYARYQFNYKSKVYFGFTADKDAGETLFKAPNSLGFDFYSMHLQIKDMAWVKNVVVGDYVAQFGQGLVLWSAMRSAKSVYVANIRKSNNGLKKYSSTNENLFMRGAGVTLGSDDLCFSLFASRKAIDATLKTDSLATSYFTSLVDGGNHGLTQNLYQKDAVRESLIGGNVSWSKSFFKLGLTSLAYKFDKAWTREIKPNNMYAFSGKENANIGADFQANFKGIIAFGEVGFSKSSAYGYLLGTLLKMTDRVNVSVLYRNYKKDYQALYAGAFAENSYVQNEQGIYLGTNISLVKRWKLSAYYDYFKFPWLKVNVNAPSAGNEFLVQADFAASKNVNMYWRIRQKTKQANHDLLPDSLHIKTLVDVKTKAIRYQIDYRMNAQWAFRNRIELSYYNKAQGKADKGFMLYQDVICSPFKFPLSISCRYAMFETDSYQARMYAYEADLLYVYSVVPYYYKGYRTYLMFKYQLSDKVEFWLRYAQTRILNKETIGSGFNEILGDTKSDIKMQLRLKF